MMNASMTGLAKEPGMTATAKGMPGLNDRLARHFVRRLRRELDTVLEQVRQKMVDPPT